MKAISLAFVLTLVAVAPSLAEEQNGIDPEALIERILAVDREQREQIHDLTLDAEYIEQEDKEDEGMVEKLRLVKKIYIKYLGDTALYHEDFLEMYKDGERQSDEALQSEAKDRREKKAKRKGRDISYPILTPFYPGYRALYDIEYIGVATERIQDRICHRFRVRANEEIDSLINGDYYFEAEGFHLVEVEFSPAKLVKKTMFKLSELEMSIIYGPNGGSYWLPKEFAARGKGKAALFFGVTFAGSEYYSNPVVNSGLDDSIFEVDNGD